MPQPRKLHDKFFKLAKAEGYVARSAYKLLEINEKKRIIRRGNRVLDLGCAPGSWLQVVEQIIGDKGIAVGIDLQRVDTRFGPNVHVIQGDIFKTDPKDLFEISGQLFNAVISDMAPNTTGHGDDFLSVRLCRRVLEMLPTVLHPGGSLVMKVLEGEEFPQLLKETRALFREAGATKPAASRDVSRETFIWGVGYQPPRQPAPQARPSGPLPPGPGWAPPQAQG